MNKRTIILISIPFTDLSEKKLRPALVLGKIQDDLLCCFLSSRLESKHSQDIVIEKSPENGLKADSVVKCGKLFTLHQSLVEKIMGKIEITTYKKVVQAIEKIIRL